MTFDRIRRRPGSLRIGSPHQAPDSEGASNLPFRNAHHLAFVFRQLRLMLTRRLRVSEEDPMLEQLGNCPFLIHSGRDAVQFSFAELRAAA